jgi:rhodanese-related sulfurtransferase
MSQEKRLRFAIAEAAALLVCSLVLAAAYNHLSGEGIPWIASERVVPYAADSLLSNELTLPTVGIDAGKQTSATPGEPLRVTLSQAHKLHADRKVIFLDAREEARYGAGHIAGAMHFPYYQPEKWDQLRATIPPQAILLTYCDDDCDSALRLADELILLGYAKVLVLDAGYDTWRQAGYPVTSGQQ